MNLQYCCKRNIISSNLIKHVCFALPLQVADFGLAKLVGRSNEEDFLATRLVGTPGYLPPEWVWCFILTWYKSFFEVQLNIVFLTFKTYWKIREGAPGDPQSWCIRIWSGSSRTDHGTSCTYPWQWGTKQDEITNYSCKSTNSLQKENLLASCVYIILHISQLLASCIYIYKHTMFSTVSSFCMHDHDEHAIIFHPISRLKTYSKMNIQWLLWKLS